MPILKRKKRKHKVLYICSNCSAKENIPQEAIDFLDIVDGGDPSSPPCFYCQLCDGTMFPYSSHRHLQERHFL